jgi:hypothetical protein
MEFQETRMNFLRDLRTEGYCVIEMHHTGKQGLQRGSSVNDDILDLQFILKRCDDWSPGQKLQFELTIGKLRHAADLEEEFVVTLDANGKWTKRTSDTETGVLELLREGKSISVVAKDMGLHPSSVKRLRKKLQQKGLLELNEKTK